ALSPVDLIPDFIPVLGYLDDLIILPLGIWLAFALIPGHVLEECRRKADESALKPKSRTGAVIISVIWAALIGLCAWKVFRCFKK
ncbi:MAG: YkvA family protein, partial [Spirochaetota bacterium]